MISEWVVTTRVLNETLLVSLLPLYTPRQTSQIVQGGRGGFEARD